MGDLCGSLTMGTFGQCQALAATCSDFQLTGDNFQVRNLLDYNLREQNSRVVLNRLLLANLAQGQVKGTNETVIKSRSPGLLHLVHQAYS